MQSIIIHLPFQCPCKVWRKFVEKYWTEVRASKTKRWRMDAGRTDNRTIKHNALPLIHVWWNVKTGNPPPWFLSSVVVWSTLQSEEEVVLFSRWLWRKETKNKTFWMLPFSTDCDLKFFFCFVFFFELLMIMLLLSFLRTTVYPSKMFLPEKSYTFTCRQ